MYGPLNDPQAVRKALREFDELGRDNFLKKYNFGRSKLYFVLDDEKKYDSKAIIAAAFGFQTGKPLRRGEFN
ncbi:hypothetical protein, partial [Tahibacter sp.]|uniref:hypothetical protein n=1 Tax=Tahibacter sp. TaxID=2056211 RepID=UPI0028C393FD